MYQGGRNNKEHYFMLRVHIIVATVNKIMLTLGLDVIVNYVSIGL